MEEPTVRAITSVKGLVKITLTGVPDRPGMAARILTDVAAAGVNVRTIIQGATSNNTNRITFVVEAKCLTDVQSLFKDWTRDLIASEVEVVEEVASIAIEGSRLASNPTLPALMFEVLADLEINIDCIGSSEMKIECVISGARLEEAESALRAAFTVEMNGT
ncbi:MAG: ACT domain-containing protein [bacterium]|nr:ACT domain-containing protein [bacterium]